MCLQCSIIWLIPLRTPSVQSVAFTKPMDIRNRALEVDWRVLSAAIDSPFEYLKNVIYPHRLSSSTSLSLQSPSRGCIHHQLLTVLSFMTLFLQVNIELDGGHPHIRFVFLVSQYFSWILSWEYLGGGEKPSAVEGDFFSRRRAI